MAEKHGWTLLDVESVIQSNPDFVAHPLPSYIDRCSLLVGELVKIIVRVFESDGYSSLYRRWVVIQSIDPGAPLRYVGDLQSGPGGKMPPDESTAIKFGPKHVYRMPPRTFTIWGTAETAFAITGNAARPCDADGNERDDCGDVILHFNAVGWDAALARYTEIAKSHPSWPQRIA